MKKKDLIEEFYNRTHFTKEISKMIIEDIFKMIIDSLGNRETIKISNFGTFKVSKKKRGKVRDFKKNIMKNAKGGEKIIFIPSQKIRRFDES
jgi:nucleoid DNA-binding protein